MMTKKITKHTNKRQTLLEENESLRNTIKALQDENSNLSIDNNQLRIDNSVWKERLSNFGLRDLCKQLGSIGLGTAVGMIANKQDEEAAIIAIISGFLLLGFSVYDNIVAKRHKEKERVGS